MERVGDRVDVQRVEGEEKRLHCGVGGSIAGHGDKLGARVGAVTVNLERKH